MELIVDNNIDWAEWENIPEDANYIKPASAWREQVIKNIHNPQKNWGAHLPWGKTMRNVRFKPGDVTVWGGINGHKKSMILGQVVIGFNHQGQKACIASLEMPPEDTLERMTLQATGLEKPSESYINRYYDSTEGYLWLYDQTGMVNHTRMTALTRYCFEKLDIDHMIIDSFMKCGIRVKDHDTQKLFIDSLCALAKDYKKHVHLVAHARKGQDEERKPNKFDIKGCGDIIDQVDNLMMVWDNKKKHEEMKKKDPKEKIAEQPDLWLMVQKQRRWKWEGNIVLWFHADSLQHIPSDSNRPMDMCGLADDEKAKLDDEFYRDDEPVL